MRARAVVVTLLLASCGGQAADAPPADPQVLMDADRAFNDATADGGSEAWASWFAEDGALMREGVGEIRGRDAIRAAVAALDDPNVSLVWDPDRADIAASGDLGWTTGEFVSTFTAPDGSVTEGRGRYVSIWRLQADGSWKVVMDLGNPTEGPGVDGA